MTSIHTILHPTDFARCSQRAFQAACSLARDHGARLLVLHVMEPMRLAGESISVELLSPPKQDRWEALRRLRAREPDLWIEPVLRKGRPAAEILALARDARCDLIVMGMHGPEGRGLPGLGGVAAEVVSRALCPVLGVMLPGVNGAARRTQPLRGSHAAEPSDGMPAHGQEQMRR